MAAAFIDGARAQGADVVDYGMMGTDMMYYAVARDGHDGGAQITASHNPKEYNGIKMVRREAFPLSGDAGIGDIRDMIASRPAAARSRRSQAACRTKHVLDDYVEQVLVVHRPVDHQAVQRRARCRQRHRRDGRAAAVREAALPDHRRCASRSTAPSPTTKPIPLIEENRRDIVERVIAEKADIGIAWDGDADRVFFIDGTGEFVAGDFVTALLAEAFLIKNPGAKVLYDVRASYAVKDVVAKYGGTALMNRVGHAFFKRRMREENAVFGGEVTGHYYFRDFYYADNGFIPALLILELMSRKGQTLAELLAPLREKYFISGEINTRLKDGSSAQEKMDGLSAMYTEGRVYSLDGISVEFHNWHFNVRASNTEPLLRLNLEATNAGSDGREARRGAGVHPELNTPVWLPASAGKAACGGLPPSLELRRTSHAPPSASFPYLTHLAISASHVDPGGTGYSNSMPTGIAHRFFFNTCSTSLIGVSPSPQGMFSD